MDFRKLFDLMPGCYLVLAANDPVFTIEAISDELLTVTDRTREECLGQSLFDVYAIEPESPAEHGKSDLHSALRRVINDKVEVIMPMIRYDVVNARQQVEERYWSTRLMPVFGDDGNVTHVLDYLKEVTHKVKLEESRDVIRTVERNFDLFMQAPVAVCMVEGPKYTVQLANEEMLSMLGRESSIIGKPILEALPEARVQGLMDILDKVRATGKAESVSNFPATLFIHGERVKKYFNLIFKPYFSNNLQEVDSIFCVAHNVTEQVVALSNLSESEDRYRVLIEETTVATALYVGADIRIQYANDIMIAYWGKDASVIGKTIREAVPELEGQKFPEILEDVYHSGKMYVGRQEAAELVVDGQLQTFYFNFTYKPLHDRDGKVYGIHHIAVDVTNQVLALKKLEEEKERTQLAIRVGELGLFDFDIEKNEINGDERFRRIFGVSDPKSIHDYFAVMYPEDIAKPGALELARRRGRLEHEFRVKDGETNFRWIKIMGHYQYRDGVAFKVFGVVQDITTQKQFQEQLAAQVQERTAELENKNRELQRSNENLEEFAHAASHDLKQPIRKIMFFADRLKDQLSDRLNDDERSTFSRILNASQRMGALIDDLLLYSHVSQVPLEKDEVDLNEKVQRVLEDLELEIQQKNAVVTLQELPTVRGYKRQLQQLFQNLIGNALKYSKPGEQPKIDIRSTIVGSVDNGTTVDTTDHFKSFYRIDIQDNGIGFEPSESERIFQLFQRLHGNAEYQGTGVGLSIAQKVARNHHGKIVAESKPGAGSRFSIYLPA